MRALRAAVGAIVIVAAAAGGLYVTQVLLAAPKSDVARNGGDQGVLEVGTVPVQVAEFADSIQAVGTARARNAIDLSIDASGRIERLNFAPGQKVRKGDLLLALESDAEEAAVKAAEATLAEAEAAFERQERLNNSGNASDAAYQTARAVLLRAQAEHQLAEIAVEERKLNAPFDGVIGLTDLVVGQQVDPSTMIATLDDLSVIEVDFSVSELVLPRLKIGQGVDVSSPSWPDRVFSGQISQIDSRIESTTRSIALRADIPNEDGALTGGMFLEVELVLAEHEQIAVPEKLLIFEGEKVFVMLARDGVVEKTEIQTGLQSDGLVEVVAGLQDDARVISTNLHRITPGLKIQDNPEAPRAQTASSDEARL